MKIHWIKYFLCVGITEGLSIAVMLILGAQPKEDLLLSLLGPPILIYLGFAKLVGLGWILLIPVFAVYFSALLLPMFFFFKNSNRRWLLIQTAFVLLHFLLGYGIKVSIHGF